MLGINACPAGLHALVQGWCNQIDACPGSTLKPVPGGGVGKMNACPGGEFYICPGGYVCNGPFASDVTN